MQNRYAGDVGDFVKLALLRCVGQGHKLGIAWYLYPDEIHNSDGRHIGYLSEPAKWRALDPVLFDVLQHVTGDSRSVSALQSSGALNAVFSDKPLITSALPSRDRSNWRERWLEDQQYGSGTITAQLHRTARVEEHYGDLEALHKGGNLQSVIDELTYSAADEKRKKPNPSKIPFEGNIRNNLASYKNAVVRYRKFLTGGWECSDADSPVVEGSLAGPVEGLAELSEVAAQKLSLERDMQAALRRDIKKLGQALSIIDDGAERSVDSGLIDITCEDSSNNAIVVVELKAGKTDSRAIGQLLGYMGDLAQEEEGREIRGILVAHEFDKRTISAARAVPALRLMRYSVEFRFESCE